MRGYTQKGIQRLGRDDFEYDPQRFGVKHPFETATDIVLPIEKLQKYALDKGHARGGNKAIAFELALGYTENTAEDLKQ